ncbi:DUF4333 domain-containing protein [Gordonia humi]|uniref:DUF4333 domain-containing protein n=1 Tax=Gordonia humi TaxID=686429 RepID=A0A840F504_9ACTN|nr:DUF4333 domain-containing protein [Gordonia humi]MBB4136569.1 hypothetical protein [Gordonia humi]
MTTGNEPTEPGAPVPDDDKTSIVERPDVPVSDAPTVGDDADATTISQLPATPAPQPDASTTAPNPGDGQAAYEQTAFAPGPQQPSVGGTAPYTQAGVPSEPTTPQPTPEYGQQAPQYGQPPAYGQQAPQYGQNPQPGVAPQYGAPGQPPQSGQPPQYGQPGPYGQAPQYGAPAYGPTGQPQFDPNQGQQSAPGQYGAPAYPQAGQPGRQPYGAPAYGQQAPQAGQQPFAADPTLNPYAPTADGASSSGGKGKLIAIIGGVVVLIAAIVLITAFVWPNWAKGGLNQSAVEQGVQKILTSPDPDGYGLKDVKNVSCPGGQKVEQGTTFTCSVTVNGDNKHVTVTVKDGDGTYEVSRPTN